MTISELKKLAGDEFSPEEYVRIEKEFANTSDRENNTGHYNLDLPHSDLRRARAASVSLIPTSTGAAKAVGLVLPAVAGKLDGIAIRVPTTDVSIVDLVCETERGATAHEINEEFRKAASGPMRGILAVSDEPLVSIDFLGNSHSSIVDAPNTKVLEGTLVKVLAWYDNEWGYANRVVDLAALVAHSL